MTYNATLAQYALNYGSNCVTQHSGGPYGENLAWGAPATSYSSQSLFQLWVDEGDDYDYSTTQFSSADGHFTQVVWAGSTQVGCAMITCPAEDLGFTGTSGNGAYLVCEYAPAGNVQGQFTQNVKPLN